MHNKRTKEALARLLAISLGIVVALATMLPAIPRVAWADEGIVPEGQGTWEPQAGATKIESREVGDSAALEYTITLNSGYHVTKWTWRITSSGKSFESVTTNTSQALTYGHDNVVAHLALNEYKVAFKANGGSETMPDQTFTYGEEKALTENSFTYPGHRFKGWNTAEDGSGISYSDKQVVKNLATDHGATVTLYAQWEEVFEITFDANGGEGEMNPIKVKKGGSTTLDANSFIFEGCEFVCWNTEANGSGDDYADEAEVRPEGDVTLYAQWAEPEPTPVPAPAPDAYTITFVGGSAAKGTMKPQVVEAGSTVPLNPNGFIVEGAEFRSWNTKSDGSGDDYADEAEITPEDDMTLYATWTSVGPSPSACVISFDANGGKGNMKSKTVQEGESTTLDANAFIYDGHYFTGWNTAKDGSGDAYADEAEVTPEGNMTLYAQWKEIVTSNPEITSSAGGNIISRTTEVTFTIKQRVPDDATSMTMVYDLDPAMQFTTSKDEITVDYEGKSAKNATSTPVPNIEGQKLTVSYADASGILGETVVVTCKAKVRSDADLTKYLNDKKTMALIPYKTSTDFKGAKDRTAASETKSLKVSKGGNSSSSGKKTASRSATPKTGDPTSLVTVVTTAGAGIAAIIAGRRRR